MSRAGAATDRVLAPAAIDIRPCVSRVLQDEQHPRAIRRLPDDLLRCRPAERSYRHSQAGLLKITHHGFGAAKLPELGKQKQQPSLHFFIRIEIHPTVAAIGETHGQRHAQLAAARLLTLALMEANLDLVQLCFAHDAGQAQQQAVVIGARVVEPLTVGNQHTEQGTKLEQLVPVAVVAGQA